MDSPWDEDPNNNVLRDAEWSKISSDFTNAGYREGITAGKEGALQEGFDAGFAEVGVPLGREMGVARGVASAVLAILSTRRKGTGLEEEAREILGQLNEVRFSDIAPRDVQAEEHAREHVEELAEKRSMEDLEDMLGALGGAGRGSRPTLDSVRVLQQRTAALEVALNNN
ncbi:hypothetical protein P691DRAFT_798546 [Macrolepiota fuliginosa MF-IS2]|uniref:Protein YAE1 n=1 Tax=Macrolepiota fuliginosa MF-IS2 TaxID=1400762 RepID=A0A9P5X2L1_9AGAR|nr:hypothetical protein P691DRAFT_798546 [Macrolepiota fuliginosa MF-IS2]